MEAQYVSRRLARGGMVHVVEALDDGVAERAICGAPKNPEKSSGWMYAYGYHDRCRRCSDLGGFGRVPMGRQLLTVLADGLMDGAASGIPAIDNLIDTIERLCEMKESDAIRILKAIANCAALILPAIEEG